MFDTDVVGRSDIATQKGYPGRKSGFGNSGREATISSLSVRVLEGQEGLIGSSIQTTRMGDTKRKGEC